MRRWQAASDWLSHTVQLSQLITVGVLHLVQCALFRLIQNIFQKHDIAFSCTHACNTTKLDVELIQCPVSCPAMSKTYEDTQKLFEMIMLTTLHLHHTHIALAHHAHMHVWTEFVIAIYQTLGMGRTCYNSCRLESMQLQKHCNLKAARPCTVPIRFNFIAYIKFEVAQPIRCRLWAFLPLIRYVTLWPWPLTHWTWKSVVDLVSRGHSL